MFGIAKSFSRQLALRHLLLAAREARNGENRGNRRKSGVLLLSCHSGAARIASHRVVRVKRWAFRTTDATVSGKNVGSGSSTRSPSCSSLCPVPQWKTCCSRTRSGWRVLRVRSCLEDPSWLCTYTSSTSLDGSSFCCSSSNLSQVSSSKSNDVEAFLAPKRLPFPADGWAVLLVAKTGEGDLSGDVESNTLGFSAAFFIGIREGVSLVVGDSSRSAVTAAGMRAGDWAGSEACGVAFWVLSEKKSSSGFGAGTGTGSFFANVELVCV